MLHRKEVTLVLDRDAVMTGPTVEADFSRRDGPTAACLQSKRGLCACGALYRHHHKNSGAVALKKSTALVRDFAEYEEASQRAPRSRRSAPLNFTASYVAGPRCLAHPCPAGVRGSTPTNESWWLCPTYGKQ